MWGLTVTSVYANKTSDSQHFLFIFLQVRTLFVSGLPMDAKPRELYLLFRAYKVGWFVQPLFSPCG